jgi:hypothetical protein
VPYGFPDGGFNLVAGELRGLGMPGDGALRQLGEAPPFGLLGVPGGALLVGPVARGHRFVAAVGLPVPLLETEQPRVSVVGCLLGADQVVWEFDGHDG